MSPRQGVRHGRPSVHLAGRCRQGGDPGLRRPDRTDGATGPVPVDERVAVFDNDGTLWCKKPMPIQLDFILRRLSEMAEADPTLREHQPWKAAYEHDYDWLARVMADHYAGDDTNVKTLGPESSRRSP